MPKESDNLNMDALKTQIDGHPKQLCYLYDHIYLKPYINESSNYFFKELSSCAHVKSDPPKKSKSKRARYPRKICDILEKSFYENDKSLTVYGNPDKINYLENVTGLTQRQITKWFSNKRINLRKKNYST